VTGAASRRRGTGRRWRAACRARSSASTARRRCGRRARRGYGPRPVEREYDQDWLDYQHEIGLRHHRAKKTVTDGFAEAAAHVSFRWLVPLVYPMAQTIRPFLHDAGAAAEEADAIAVAFTKSLLLQITLWSRAYVGNADW
jgi:hypothetical protein